MACPQVKRPRRRRTGVSRRRDRTPRNSLPHGGSHAGGGGGGRGFRENAQRPSVECSKGMPLGQVREGVRDARVWHRHGRGDGRVGSLGWRDPHPRRFAPRPLPRRAGEVNAAARRARRWWASVLRNAQRPPDQAPEGMLVLKNGYPEFPPDTAKRWHADAVRRRGRAAGGGRGQRLAGAAPVPNLPFETARNWPHSSPQHSHHRTHAPGFTPQDSRQRA
jgi:hypothetical protein